MTVSGAAGIAGSAFVPRTSNFHSILVDFGDVEKTSKWKTGSLGGIWPGHGMGKGICPFSFSLPKSKSINLNLNLIIHSLDSICPSFLPSFQNLLFGHLPFYGLIPFHIPKYSGRIFHSSPSIPIHTSGFHGFRIWIASFPLDTCLPHGIYRQTDPFLTGLVMSGRWR